MLSQRLPRNATHGCPENFLDSLSVPDYADGSPPQFFHVPIDPTNMRTEFENLTSVALPVPGIIGVPENGQFVDMPTLPLVQFLMGFSSNES